MKGSRNGVIAKLCAKQLKVVDIHCNCHVLNLCVKSAVKLLPFKLDELMINIFYHFHHSVKRVTSLQEYAMFVTWSSRMSCHIMRPSGYQWAAA